MRLRATPVTLTVLLALLAGSTLADHVYTHRYVVSGRVVLDDGSPAANVSVVLHLGDRSSLHERCWTYQDEMRVRVLGLPDPDVTNEAGDFEACLHAHAIPAGTTIVLEVDGVRRNLTMDPDTRLSFDDVTFEDEPGNGTLPAFLVRVRVWRPVGHALEVDHVPATGYAIQDARVTATVTLDNGTVTTWNLTTDQYGDAALYLPTEEGVAGNVTLATADAEPVTRPFAADTRRVDAILLLPRHTIGSPGGSAADFDPEPGSPVPLPWALLLAGAAVAAFTRRASAG